MTTIDVRPGGAHGLDAETLLREYADITTVILANVPDDDRATVDDLLTALRERVIAWVGAQPSDYTRAIEVGRTAGAQQGIRAGYVRGLQDGIAKAKAELPKPEPPAVIDFIRDADGRPIEVIETRGDKVTRKLISHDADGR